MEMRERLQKRMGLMGADSGKVTHLNMENQWYFGANHTGFLSLSSSFHMLFPLWSFSGFGQAYLLSQSLRVHMHMRVEALKQ
jgi:hypothetical protein